MILRHFGAQFLETVKRQGLAEHVGQRPQYAPVLTRIARCKDRLVGALDPAFEIDIGAVLLGIGRARQDHIRRMGPGIAMMADEDLEAVLERLVIHFIGTEREQQFRFCLGNRLDTTIMGIAEQQSAGARGTDMQDIEAVPAILDQLVFGREFQCSAMCTVDAERTATKNDRRLLRTFQRFRQGLGQLRQQAHIIAQPLDRIGLVRFRSDTEHLRMILPHRLADAGVDQRRFPARIGRDQQDHICFLDPSDGGVEIHRSEARHIIGQPGLAAFQHVGAHRFQQLLRRVHGLAIHQIAGNRGHRTAGFHIGYHLKRFVPARFFQLAVLAHIRLVETALHQPVDRMTGFVGRPFLVHVIVDARQCAQHFATTAVDADIGADAVHHVDAERLGQFPRTRFKRIRLASQSANRAKIDDIAG